ncbi:hypothetical protein JHK87_054943 [Glycine soja]|nr:hypothetical protein JHK87_054943 [Glycine soja]
MDIIYDLIEEAKLRFLWWALCIFAISYFFTHTSKSMWMNLPMSILFVAALRILLNKVEFHWKVQPPRLQTYLSHLEKNQLPLNDERLSSSPPTPKWKKKIDSPVVEAALNDFIDLILKDFVINMWYADITPDMEFPELVRDLIMDAIAEVSARVKEINLVDLLTRDIVDLIGDHIDLFRRNQDAIGVDVMLTLSSEERDERLKFHLLNSKELHPALISPESEYKVLQRLMSGLLATVIRKREVQCPVIRSIAREIVTCLIVQPVMNLASPASQNFLYMLMKKNKVSNVWYINELIESLLVFLNDECINWTGGGDHSTNTTIHNHGHSGAAGGGHDNHASSSDWAQMLEAATQRRTEVLMPENLENMWARGRNYRRKQHKKTKVGFQDPSVKNPATDAIPEGKSSLHYVSSDPLLTAGGTNRSESPPDHDKELSSEADPLDEVKDMKDFSCNKYKDPFKRSRSASLVGIQTYKGGSPSSSDMVNGFQVVIDGIFWCASFIQFDCCLLSTCTLQVLGAYFEKLGSTSFAVYSIAVTDGQEKTWFVRRRYRNFEQLHRHLKDIPNYVLHLPPKRIFSSSTEDAFVYQRCIQFDKYLQDLLSIANIAEQHEVWDFLSVSSKNYSFGKSSSMMRTLAVNVDDAVDDIVRQFKGVSDGFIQKVVGSSSPSTEGSSTSTSRNMSWNVDEMDKSISRQNTLECVLSSDNEEVPDNLEDVPPEVCNENKSVGIFSTGCYIPIVFNFVSPYTYGQYSNTFLHSKVLHSCADTREPWINLTFLFLWTPPNVTVPILNLVDKVFQLKKRGWLRRQVFWISKQILQVVMEDAIDDWLLSEIHWLRKEETVALGIRWVQDTTGFVGGFCQWLVLIGGSACDQKSSATISESGGSSIPKSQSGSFEQQLEATRRASELKKLLFDGAPSALVSLIGQKQYKRCASDIYYFSQSSICVKQLAYAILELLLISIFPELRNVVISVHENMHVHQPV